MPRNASAMTVCLALILAAIPPQASALERCLALAKGPLEGLVVPATFRPAGLEQKEARITFVGHSTFLIESAKGVRIATDYSDYVKPAVVPEIVTMNRAHDSHYTNYPEPTIRHVLRGWNPDGGPVEHDVTHEDVRVRNVPTHIRGWDGGAAQFANSIFIFEVGELCIAHLGHLHHTLRTEQLAQLGMMDVVLVPVDGTYTLDLDGMMEVLQAIRAPLMIPMHYFSRYTLDRFITKAREVFEVRESDSPTIVVSRASLPPRQEVLVLPGR